MKKIILVCYFPLSTKAARKEYIPGLNTEIYSCCVSHGKDHQKLSYQK